MSCHNPFCTCCHDAYFEGLRDGYRLGHKRGHEAGYIRGYIDAAMHLPPPIPYQPPIQMKLAPYLQPAPDDAVDILPKRRLLAQRTCWCIGLCTCGNR